MGFSLISATCHSLILDEWLWSPAPHTLYLAKPNTPDLKVCLEHYTRHCICKALVHCRSSETSFPSLPIYIHALLCMAGSEMLESTQAGPLPPKVQDAVIQVGLWWCVLV